MTEKSSVFSSLIDNVLDRVTEIIWWNRQLTKLDDPNYIQNYEDFIKKDLIEVKGPYIEYVRPPMTSSQSLSNFLRSLNYNEVAINSFVKTLFGGDESLPLYWHQQEAIEKIHYGDSPVVVSVPTATGKTECFLLPILNYCIECNEKGVKALIIYPTKTLEVDQLNRFIRYLDIINENSQLSKQVTIGIWDGDTPNRVGVEVENDQIPVNSFVRGIECPRCGEKLRINERGQLSCANENRSFSWIQVTRRRIRKKGVDILLTNPEALDYLQINPDPGMLEILGGVPGKAPLKFIVFDEAHIWTGVTGSGINLLITRLLNFFEASKPRLVLLSATISNPQSLGKELTGQNKIEVVQFKPKEISFPEKVDFSRIKSCSVPNLLNLLTLIGKITTDSKDLQEKVDNFDNTIYMLKLLGLITGESSFSLTVDGHSILNSIIISSGGEIENQDLLIEKFLESDKFQEKWQEIVLKRMPEVQRLASFFPNYPNKPSFVSQEFLVDKISFESSLDKLTSEEVLLTCLNIGRAANLLTDKHHLFIRPPSEMFYCESCKRMMTSPVCSRCKNIGKQVKVCKVCHLPYIAEEKGRPKDESESNLFFPLYDIERLENGNKCPNCLSRKKLVDPNVPYPTMVTFLASAICRLLPSKKVLIFSDSRRTAERMGADIIENDYSLVAQQLFIRFLLDNGGNIGKRDLYFNLIDELKKRYYLYLHNELDKNDETSHRLIDELLEQHIKKLGQLFANKRLFSQAIVTVQTISEFSDAIDVLLGHELFKLLMNRRSFQKERKKISGLTPDRIVESLSNRLPFLLIPDIERRLSRILKKLVDSKIIQNISIKETLSELDSLDTDQQTIEKLTDYFNEELEKLNTSLRKQKLDELVGPFFKLELFRTDFSLHLVKDIFFCQRCYSVFPAKSSAVFKCPKCGGELDFVSRWDEENQGRLPNSKINYMIDHWGNDVAHIAATNSMEEIPHISVGVNRAGIPSSLRGIIEEGFRKSVPKINVISATTIMELGIDIGTLDVVCQIGMPPTISNYVQRSGRAGRVRGRPSLILTVIRGDHPIDSYYFEKIDGFLSSSDKLSVPSPFDFPSILGSHVTTEVLSYLARNPDPRDIYNKVFTIKNFSGQAGEFAEIVISRIQALVQLIREIKKDELENHVAQIFGKKGIEIFRKIFIENEDDSLLKKAEETFGNLSEVGNVTVGSEKSMRQLGNWMSKLGLLANYRGMNEQIPIVLETKTGSGTVEFKSYDQAIRESYPGPRNTDGAVFYVAGNKFVVKSVYGLDKKLLHLKTCYNDKLCDLPFKVYQEDFEFCPFCEHELGEIEVYQMGPIKTRAARKLYDNFKTYAIQSHYVELSEIIDEQNLSFFGMPAKIIFGKTREVSFTPGFDKSWYGRTSKFLLSQAKIEQNKCRTSNLSPIDRILKEQEVPYHPVGYLLNTYGVTIELDRATLENRLGEEKNWLHLPSIISLIQALKKAICIVTKCELQDFGIDFSVGMNKLSVHIFDAKEGGNNVSMMVKDDMLGNQEIFDQIKKIANCSYCSEFCDRCLLIRYTPSYILRKNLLNRQDLKGLLNI